MQTENICCNSKADTHCAREYMSARENVDDRASLYRLNITRGKISEQFAAHWKVAD